MVVKPAAGLDDVLLTGDQPGLRQVSRGSGLVERSVDGDHGNLLARDVSK
jgi:hypothetical protein